MPHKRAKLSIRREKAQESDLPPTGDLTLSQEGIPKTLLRVLQAEQIRKAHRAKRAREDGEDEPKKGGDGKRQKKEDDSKNLVIKHGESLKKFNRRVEDEMRAQVAEAMQISRSVTKKTNKEEKKAKEARIALAQSKGKSKESKEPKEDSTTTTDTPAEVPVVRSVASGTEFAKAEQRKRLNDVVQEPPTLTKLPRGVKSTTTGNARTGVVSMAQKHMMEVERERAVKRYRELKERKLAQKEV